MPCLFTVNHLSSRCKIQFCRPRKICHCILPLIFRSECIQHFETRNTSDYTARFRTVGGKTSGQASRTERNMQATPTSSNLDTYCTCSDVHHENCTAFSFHRISLLWRLCTLHEAVDWEIMSVFNTCGSTRKYENRFCFDWSDRLSQV